MDEEKPISQGKVIKNADKAPPVRRRRKREPGAGASQVRPAASSLQRLTELFQAGVFPSPEEYVYPQDLNEMQLEQDARKSGLWHLTDADAQEHNISPEFMETLAKLKTKSQQRVVIEASYAAYYDRVAQCIQEKDESSIKITDGRLVPVAQLLGAKMKDFQIG